MAYDGSAIVWISGDRAMNAGRVIQSVVVTACALALAASLALADPGVRVTYVSGVPQVELEGSYAQSHYAVYRGADMNERGVRITSDDLLCIGPCWAQDPAAGARAARTGTGSSSRCRMARMPRSARTR
jgi:hypothetical protein